jgi:hypothetical protein
MPSACGIACEVCITFIYPAESQVEIHQQLAI